MLDVLLLFGSLIFPQCRFRSDTIMSDAIQEAEQKVMSGNMTPGTACDWLIDIFFEQAKHT